MLERTFPIANVTVNVLPTYIVVSACEIRLLGKWRYSPHFTTLLLFARFTRALVIIHGRVVLRLFEVEKERVFNQTLATIRFFV